MSREVILEAEALIERGLQLYSGGKLDEALQCWQAALHLLPDVERAGDYIRYVEENRVALERTFGLRQAGGAASDEGSGSGDDFDIDVAPVQTGQVVAVQELSDPPPMPEEKAASEREPEADEDTSRIILDSEPFQGAVSEFAPADAGTPLRLVDGADEPAGLDFEPMEPTPVGIELPEPARLVPAVTERRALSSNDLLPVLEEPAGGRAERKAVSTSETLLGVHRDELARRPLAAAGAEDRGVMVEAAPSSSSPAPHAAELYAPDEQGEERVEAMLAGAWQLHEQETHEGSLWLCQRILAIDPDNQEAGELLERNRNALLQHYEARLDNFDEVPVVKVPQHEVIWHKLDHRAGFLLSRVDGTLSYSEILDVSGMSRFEACRILAQLLEQGVIGPR